jgi:signal peptidase II
MTPAGKRLALILLVVTTVGCDRVTKHLATTRLEGTPGKSYLADTIRLEYAENAGTFLSLGSNLSPPIRTGVFTILTGLVLIGAVVAAMRLGWRGGPLVGLSLVFAGGASNLIDRVTRGSVIDFLNVGVGWLRTGIFNLADVAVTLGVGVLLLTHARSSRVSGTRPSPAREPRAS